MFYLRKENRRENDFQQKGLSIQGSASAKFERNCSWQDSDRFFDNGALVVLRHSVPLRLWVAEFRMGGWNPQQLRTGAILVEFPRCNDWKDKKRTAHSVQVYLYIDLL